MKTRFERIARARVGRGQIDIELDFIKGQGGNGYIKCTIVNSQYPDQVITFDLRRREAYQLADTLRAMAYSADYRL